MLLLKQHINVFSNSNKVAHSRMLPTDQMIKNLEDKLRHDLHEIIEKGFIIANYEQKVDNIRANEANDII